MDGSLQWSWEALILYLNYTCLLRNLKTAVGESSIALWSIFAPPWSKLLGALFTTITGVMRRQQGHRLAS
jgi:hypothetical protein